MPVVELVILSVVSNIISNVISNISSSGISSYINKPDKFSSLFEICQKGSILRSNLSMIQGWLKDVELNKPRRNLDDVCLREIELVAYDARDAIDKLSWLLQEVNAAGTSKSREYIQLLPDLGIKIDNINSSIGRIHEMKKKLADLISEENSVMDGQSDNQRLENYEEIIPTNEDEEVVGFGKQINEIKAKLIDKQKAKLIEERHERLGILSVVGMGGIGKSTLARKIFNDSDVGSHFPMRIWIGISEQYNVHIKSNNNDQIKSEDADQKMTCEKIIPMLIKYLEKGRCLIVIDGIWAIKLWKATPGQKCILSSIHNGSKIIQTTRKFDVARFPSELGIETDVYEVKLLDEEKSWELLEKKAFQSNAMANKTTRNKLVNLRKELTQKCNGLPLALIALGDCISNELTNRTWSRKPHEIDWCELAKDGINISQSLALSYNDIPPRLKPLFLYITSFPAGEFIRVSELIKLWIAEEFIQPDEEKAGRNFVEELQERCLFKEVKRSKARGWITKIKIHDVLCDWGRTIAKKEKFLSVINCRDHAEVARDSYRVALHGYGVDDLSNPMSNMRSLLGFHLPEKKITCSSLYSPRVVTFNPNCINKSPQCIEQMIFLRYICLRKFDNIKLPQIEQLYSLQTLDCRESTINSLSDSLWKILHLRHVYLKDVCCNWNGPEKGSGKNLRSLYIYDRAPKKSSDRLMSSKYTGLSGIADAVEEMPGIVALRLITHAGSLPQNILYKISLLSTLEVLELREEASQPKNKGLSTIPPNYVFPESLIKIKLGCVNLEIDPMPFLRNLPKLVVLELINVKLNRMDFSGFLVLEYLTLINFLGKNLEADAGAMPNLSHLKLDGCKNLKKIPKELKDRNDLERELTNGTPNWILA